MFSGKLLISLWLAVRCGWMIIVYWSKQRRWRFLLNLPVKLYWMQNIYMNLVYTFFLYNQNIRLWSNKPSSYWTSLIAIFLYSKNFGILLGRIDLGWFSKPFIYLEKNYNKMKLTFMECLPYSWFWSAVFCVLTYSYKNIRV